MRLRTARLFARPPLLRARWRQAAPLSTHTSSLEEPQWFQGLRSDMLERSLPSLYDPLDESTEIKLGATLRPFCPEHWKQLIATRKGTTRIVPIGNHLTRFNPAVHTDELLPDGMDKLHCPGGPFQERFKERLWAGGLIRINPELYFHTLNGFVVGTDVVCTERIRDVQLRGQHYDAKIFVTIQREFYLESDMTSAMKPKQNVNPPLIEERTLVFRQRRAYSKHQSVRYLAPPSDPTFTHSLTPTRMLLFRYSALTFNAHAIHYDPQYAFNVEGHRSLLVHGPLLLTFMLKFISAHLESLPGPLQTVQSIEYRNLAPLYCDETLKLCGKNKKDTDGGSLYDVWIENDAGGCAVKATVSTVLKPDNEPEIPK